MARMRKAARRTISLKTEALAFTISWAAARRAHDAPQVSRVYLNHRNLAFLAEKAAGAVQIAVAAGDLMTLAGKQVSEIRAGRSGPQNEDAHWGKTVPHSFGKWRACGGSGGGAIAKWSV